jgi:hypothetical protein
MHNHVDESDRTQPALHGPILAAGGCDAAERLHTPTASAGDRDRCWLR